MEIRKHSTAEEAEESEPEERTRTVLNPGPTEDGTKVSEDTDWNEQRVTTSQGIMKVLACYKEALKEKEKVFCLGSFSV